VTEVTAVEDTSRHWFLLESENEALRREKGQLEKEIVVLRELLKNANVSIGSSRTPR
jgi:transcription elongation GreA/GreB family factor